MVFMLRNSMGKKVDLQSLMNKAARPKGSSVAFPKKVCHFKFFKFKTISIFYQTDETKENISFKFV